MDFASLTPYPEYLKASLRFQDVIFVLGESGE